ncbi:cobalt-precorrin-5B (C(1))-methyltransferase [Methanospirillum lacunae]|uniref:Cobalt-precorrin-5B (C(1))-methyltransferase n=1 Tax=Methanospirillum lacunae TaxID=668570 RepID=A0A2V2MSX3_9EURY|nr:cobalt-precorrin-5B (C(1))-methyltransferase [Methanospirillum lacunae]PWR70509.1 cobalt-precorrin-5B (C(1))-methyltransferase [Methanospirillum lacunae]
MFDPVSGFVYPESWVDACEDPKALEAVESGLAVLTADGKILHRGFTTGTTAAAAVKAAILSLKDPVSGLVTILTPSGIRVLVKASGENGHGISEKYSGDYPDDVTAGIRFHAFATLIAGGCEVITGDGIGKWDRENPRYPKGSPAISPPAMAEIRDAMNEALNEINLSGVRVILSAENGSYIASLTLNAKVGVSGGISVLGSTGFVEPWDDHLEETMINRISGTSRVVLTTGRIGLKYSRLLFPSHEVILIGSRIGPALHHAHGDVILCGLPALILKFINPAILEGSGFGTVEEMIGTSEFDKRVQESMLWFCAKKPGLRIILLDRIGRILKEAP